MRTEGVGLPVSDAGVDGHPERNPGGERPRLALVPTPASEELARLIEEQRRDDNYSQKPESFVSHGTPVLDLVIDGKLHEPRSEQVCPIHGAREMSFHPSQGKRRCLACTREYGRQWRAEHPHYNRDLQRRHRREKGIPERITGRCSKGHPPERWYKRPSGSGECRDCNMEKYRAKKEARDAERSG